LAAPDDIRNSLNPIHNLRRGVPLIFDLLVLLVCCSVACGRRAENGLPTGGNAPIHGGLQHHRIHHAPALLCPQAHPDAVFVSRILCSKRNVNKLCRGLLGAGGTLQQVRIGA
jgi:hypothetical protein